MNIDFGTIRGGCYPCMHLFSYLVVFSLVQGTDADSMPIMLLA